VGFGASALAVDPRTDLVYVGREGEARLRILDPLTLVEVDAIALPGAAGAIAVDDAENALVVALPAEGRVVLVDLTSKRIVASLDVGHGPDDVAVSRERVR
jgi:DNA-binding beta-propeller fold protein YncE